ERNDLRIVWIDPHRVVVVTSRCSFHRRKVLATIRRPVSGNISDVDCVLVLWINPYACEIVASAPNAFVGVDALPTFAGIVGAIQTTKGRRIHQRVDAAGIAWRDT